MTVIRLLVVAAFICTACGGRAVRVVQPQPQPLGAAPPASVQALYEAGRDQDVITRAATTPDASPEARWFAAHSHLRTGQRAEATAEFTRLVDSAPGEGFRTAGQLALARLAGEANLADGARAAAARVPGDAFVQFEAGLTLALQNEMAEAARAFDAAIAAAPQFAYAYYQAGLAYSRLERADLTVARFETFVRLAPEAPERAQVDSILRTARGR